MKNKAQIKMFETVGVLIIFFFLLAVAATFYTKIQKAELDKEIKKQSELSASQIAERAFFMPELDCSFVGIQVPNCFDTEKIKAFSELPDKTKIDTYFQSFGEATIKVNEVWPGNTETTLYSYTPTQQGSQLVSRSPVLLYYPLKNTYRFGVIEVTAYVQ